MRFMDKITTPKGLVLPPITKPPKFPARHHSGSPLAILLSQRLLNRPIVPASSHLPRLPSKLLPRFFSDTQPNPHCRSPGPVAAGARTRTPRAAVPSTSCGPWAMGHGPWAMTAAMAWVAAGGCDPGAERLEWLQRGSNWERQLRNKKY